ncbi:MAG: YcbK family protein [Candidatus Zixiibacteriota bacterium]
MIKNILDYNISSHIKLAEIVCHCGCGFGSYTNDFSIETATAFEKIRTEIAKVIGREIPLIITSACRCKFWNDEIGGSADSRHIHGDALDIRCPKELDYDTFFDICDRIIGRNGGVGYYEKSNFMHIDTRGQHVRWMA